MLAIRIDLQGMAVALAMRFGQAGHHGRALALIGRQAQVLHRGLPGIR